MTPCLRHPKIDLFMNFHLLSSKFSSRNACHNLITSPTHLHDSMCIFLTALIVHDSFWNFLVSFNEDYSAHTNNYIFYVLTLWVPCPLWNGMSPAVVINKDVTSFPLTLINRDVKAISDSRPPNVNWGSQKGTQVCDPEDVPTPLPGDCWGVWGRGMWEIKRTDAGPRYLRYIWKKWLQ